MSKPEICIIGGGLIGLSAAYLISLTGNPTTLIAPAHEKEDMRTTALLDQTVKFFEKHALWEHLSKNAFPLKTMRIVDGSNRLIRSQQVDFHASEIELDAFGYNVKNQDVIGLLQNKIANQPNITSKQNRVSDIHCEEGKYTITLNDGSTVKADILIGADGRNSIVSQFMQQEPKRWTYPQTALVVDFKHTISSNYTSTEFHRENGPFTIVPHSLNKAGLVWMDNPEKIDQLLMLSEQELEAEIERNMQSFLGKIKIQNKAQQFPLSGMVAQQFGAENHVLIGEAAHVFPPIGAQGFNLGIRDLEILMGILENISEHTNIGLTYHQLRVTDINTRTYGVDILNRSLLSDFLPVQFLKAAGIFALKQISPLRKLVMKLGIAPKST